MSSYMSLIRASRRPQSLLSIVQTSTCRRSIHISQASTSDSPSPNAGGDAFGSLPEISDPADARFELLGTPSSLLSVSLSASQKLYTRRGSLVSVTGQANNATSTLSLLSPLKRAFLGIPFLYQKLSSTTALSALIAPSSSSSTHNSLSILHLDGTTDYIVAGRKSLLAWTGHTLKLQPQTNTSLHLANWGNTQVTGRGLVALTAPGQIYKITLTRDEEYTVHPAHIVAYSLSSSAAPLPYRFKSTTLRFQIPSLGASNLLSRQAWYTNLTNSSFVRAVGRILHRLRTSTRKTIYGDRLFLTFKGPTEILVSGRAARIADILSREQINELADVPAGDVARALAPKGSELVKTSEKGSVGGVENAGVRMEGIVHKEN